MADQLRLKELRKMNKMSQAEFALAIGMLQQQYSRYEKGEREPQLKHIRRICKRFNVSADWLLCLDLETEGGETDERNNDPN